MDLREMLQRRLRKKQSPTDTNSNNIVQPRKPDPPTSNDVNRASDIRKVDVTALKNVPIKKRQQNQPIELGTIEYCNITNDGKHGDYNLVLQLAKEIDKPIFANFVEWSG
jgi:hypothetical protein